MHAPGRQNRHQLWHVGRVSHCSLQPGNAATVAPSALRAQAKTYVVDAATGQGQFAHIVPRALKAEELPDIVHHYAAAAYSAVHTAGFDGVELHGANGYLLDQFLKGLGPTSAATTTAAPLPTVYAWRWKSCAPWSRPLAAAVGIRLSPVTPSNDIYDSHPQTTVRTPGATAGAPGPGLSPRDRGLDRRPREIADRPFDYAAFKAAYRNAGGRDAWMVNNGYDRALALQGVAGGHADMVAGWPGLIANPTWCCACTVTSH